MSDILKSINWDELLTANPKATHLPDLIRTFHTTESQQKFDDLFKQFSEFIHPMGLITATTIPASRVLLLLLKDADNPFRKFAYLRVLYWILCSTQVYLDRRNVLSRARWRELQPSLPTEFRSKLTIYDIISAEFDLFVQLLTDNPPSIQIACIAIIIKFPEKLQSDLSILIDCIDQSKNHWVKTVGIFAYAEVCHLRSKKRQSYADRLSLWLTIGDGIQVRYAAALGLARVHPLATSPPEIAIDTIAKNLTVNFWEHAPIENVEVKRLVQVVTKLDYPVYSLFYSFGSRNISLILNILNRSNLKPLQAHEYYREVLNSVFERLTNDPHDRYFWWDNHNHLKPVQQSDSIMYGRDYKRLLYEPDKPLIDIQRDVLQSIVDCDPFWEIPTNLFSYYYGLLDEREALRHLLEEV